MERPSPALTSVGTLWWKCLLERLECEYLQLGHTFLKIFFPFSQYSKIQPLTAGREDHANSQSGWKLVWRQNLRHQPSGHLSGHLCRGVAKTPCQKWAGVRGPSCQPFPTAQPQCLSSGKKPQRAIFVYILWLQFCYCESRKHLFETFLIFHLSFHFFFSSIYFSSSFHSLLLRTHWSWKLNLNRLTTSPLPLPRSHRRSVSPEVHAISSEWISLTVGGGSPPAAPTPPLPPLPTVSYRCGEYLPPPFSASPVPPIAGSPYCISPGASPAASPLPPPHPPRPNSTTPFLTFTPPQVEDFLLSPPSPHLSHSMSPCSGPVLEGWLRGEKDLTEGDVTEGERGHAAQGNKPNGPAEVSSAWCAVLHLQLTLKWPPWLSFDCRKQAFVM